VLRLRLWHLHEFERVGGAAQGGDLDRFHADLIFAVIRMA